MGLLNFFLELEVTHSKEEIYLSQRKYCLDLLQESGLLGTKPYATPLDYSIKLHIDNGKSFKDIRANRRLIGRLFYLNTTMHDVTYATQQLSQFIHNPTMVHYHAACRVTCNLKSNPDICLIFSRKSELQILGFFDADWTWCLDSRKSISGYCFFLGSSLISCRAKK